MEDCARVRRGARIAMIAAAPHVAESNRAASEFRMAQAAPERPHVVRSRPHIEVYPARPAHRECVDGYRVGPRIASPRRSAALHTRNRKWA